MNQCQKMLIWLELSKAQSSSDQEPIDKDTAASSSSLPHQSPWVTAEEWESPRKNSQLFSFRALKDIFKEGVAMKWDKTTLLLLGGCWRIGKRSVNGNILE